MSKCNFCGSLGERRRIAEKIARNESAPDFKIEFRYSAAFVEQLFTEGSKVPRSTSTHYAYPLNFCPECGRELPINSAIDSAGECH